MIFFERKEKDKKKGKLVITYVDGLNVNSGSQNNSSMHK